MTRKTSKDFRPEVLDLFDKYVHGMLSRRGFLRSAGKYAAGAVTAELLLEQLSPNFAMAQQVPATDARIKATYVELPSPQGYGTLRGYLVQPAQAPGKQPTVLVVHENRGLNPHIEDIARRLALAGFIAFAPDALFPLGGYDERVNAGWPKYEEALKSARVNYQAYVYPGVEHGFNNDTAPRYDAAAAKLAWQRTVAFFNQHLRG